MKNIKQNLWINVLILLSIFICCQVQKPSEPSGPAKINLSVRFSETADGCDRFYSIPPCIQAKKVSDDPQIFSSPLSIEEVQIVFYDVDMDTGALFDNYDRYIDELDSAFHSLTEDAADFENYWIARDQIELDMVARGKNRIEKRGQLNIDGHHAAGEFELSEGLKACRVGCFDQGELHFVGASTDYETQSGFFFVVAGETRDVSVYLYQISGYDYY